MNVQSLFVSVASCSSSISLRAALMILHPQTVVCLALLYWSMVISVVHDGTAHVRNTHIKHIAIIIFILPFVDVLSKYILILACRSLFSVSRS